MELRTLSETENARFKLLNRYTGFRLILTENQCWIVETHNPNRYTQVIFEGVKYSLHRLSATLFLTNQDTSKCVCHKCDVAGCCNPSHLYFGDDSTNAKDRRYRRQNGIAKGEVINRPVKPDLTMEF